MRRGTPGAVITLAALALLLSACERGCFWKRFSPGAAPGGGGAGPRGSELRDGSAAVDLGGTDCSDGLARCVDGRVETSIAAHVPYPCASPREQGGGACACPWTPAGRCAGTLGCVKDGIEVVATPEVALVQLCAAAEPLVRPVTATESAAEGAPICADETVRCAHGIVRTCSARGQPERMVAACVGDCAPGIAVEPADMATSDGVAAILCRRAHAERR